LSTLVKEVLSLPATYSITAEQEETRNQIALRATAVKTVTDPQSQELARSSVVEIRKHLKFIEEARMLYTRPLLDAQKLVKGIADDYCKPLEDQITRLEKLGTDYSLAERRRVEEAERQRQREIERLNAERIAAEEAAAKAAQKVNTDGQLAKAIEKEAVAFQAAEKVQEVIRAPLPEVSRAKGERFTKKLRHEVTDIKAVYAARPELCKIEIKPAAVQATCVPEMPVPGLKLWWEESTTYSSR